MREKMVVLYQKCCRIFGFAFIRSVICSFAARSEEKNSETSFIDFADRPAYVECYFITFVRCFFSSSKIGLFAPDVTNVLLPFQQSTTRRLYVYSCRTPLHRVKNKRKFLLLSRMPVIYIRSRLLQHCPRLFSRTNEII